MILSGASERDIFVAFGALSVSRHSTDHQKIMEAVYVVSAHLLHGNEDEAGHDTERSADRPAITPHDTLVTVSHGSA